MTITVKVVVERAIAGDRLMVYVGMNEARLELSGILWVDHADSAEIVRRLEASAPG